jgi:hypothetical protein
LARAAWRLLTSAGFRLDSVPPNENNARNCLLVLSAPLLQFSNSTIPCYLTPQSVKRR